MSAFLSFFHSFMILTSSGRRGRLTGSLGYKPFFCFVFDFGPREWSQRLGNGQGIHGEEFSRPGDCSRPISDHFRPVSTADICPVSTENIWQLRGHLGMDENDFDPFFSPKMRKMEHRTWRSRSRRSPGNATTGGCAEPRSTRAGGQDYVSS